MAAVQQEHRVRRHQRQMAVEEDGVRAQLHQRQPALRETGYVGGHQRGDELRLGQRQAAAAIGHGKTVAAQAVALVDDFGPRHDGIRFGIADTAGGRGRRGSGGSSSSARCAGGRRNGFRLRFQKR